MKIIQKHPEIFYPLIIFLIWRLVIWILAYCAEVKLPDAYYPFQVHVPGNHLLKLFAKWDSVYYLKIAESGYQKDLLEFFPLFPILIGGLSKLFSIAPLLAGQIIVNLSTFFGLIFFYKLLQLDFKEGFSKKTLLYLLIFPTSFFLTALYSEPLFFFLVLASFFYARKSKWYLVGIFGFFAALTRIMGVILFLPLLIEYLDQKKFKLKNIKLDIIFLFLILLGLLSYIYYSYYSFGEPFYFITAQRDFGRSFQPFFPLMLFNKIISLGQISAFFSENYLNNLTDLVFISFLIYMVIIGFKSLKKSYFVYSFLFLLVPLLSGSLVSINRFILPIFPVYILLAGYGERNKNFDTFWRFISSILLGYFIALFVNGYWVG